MKNVSLLNMQISFSINLEYSNNEEGLSLQTKFQPLESISILDRDRRRIGLRGTQMKRNERAA